ncbi:DUF305 domain-containing protein [Caldichromatium japonicum]|nr:DUF305 domain-containing protein [Caldichromatium japonicum]
MTTSSPSPTPASPTSRCSQCLDSPFGARFIDAMIPHHQDALAMARQALAEAQQPEIRQLAESILSAQQAEIERMQIWRTRWIQ